MAGGRLGKRRMAASFRERKGKRAFCASHFAGSILFMNVNSIYISLLISTIENHYKFARENFLGNFNSIKSQPFLLNFMLKLEKSRAKKCTNV